MSIPTITKAPEWLQFLNQVSEETLRHFPSLRSELLESAHELHFRLAREELDSSLLAFIHNPENEKKVLSRSRLKGRFTPLVIATALRKIEVVEAILEQMRSNEKVDLELAVNARVGGNWTALHFAALDPDERLYNLLVRYGANPELCTSLGGKAREFKMFNRSVVSVAEEVDNIFFKTIIAPMRPITAVPQEELSALTGLDHYQTYQSIVGLDSILSIQLEEPKPELPFGTILFAQESMQEPQLLVAPEEILGEGSRSYGVFAEEKIQSGRLIAPYLGKTKREEKDLGSIESLLDRSSASAYTFSHVDSMNEGNAARWINNGWPNTFVIEKVFNGIELPYIFAGTTIPKGEPLYFSYGITDIELSLNSPQKLLGAEKMREFFKRGLKNTLKLLFPICNSTIQSALREKNASHISSAFLSQSRQVYLFDNPMALLDLHFRGVVNAEEVLELLSGITFRDASIEHSGQTWAALRPAYVWVVRVIASTIRDFERKTESSPLFREWVLSKVENETVIKIVKSMQMVIDVLPLDEGDEEALLASIDEQLKDYDYKTDENFPFSIDNLAKNVVENFEGMGLSLQSLNEFSASELISGEESISKNVLLRALEIYRVSSLERDALEEKEA
jgi:hypothetical protein